MKFGVREICNVVFKAKADTKIGNKTFKKGQPVLYIDTAKTSTVEGAATTVYATGGPGNTRLIAWEGEKTLTFTVEDALLSPIGFSILSGAGLFKESLKTTNVHVHSTAKAIVSAGEAEDDSIKIDLPLGAGETIDTDAPIFCAIMDEGDSFTGELIEGPVASGQSITASAGRGAYATKPVFVDFYIQKKAANVSELQIDGRHFAGYYYVEASTLFRRQSDGVDLPAELTFPNVKVQSNFTFQMASTGDPSTFTFTMDAFPGYTIFDKTKKVLCVMQIVEDVDVVASEGDSVMAVEA